VTRSPLRHRVDAPPLSRYRRRASQETGDEWDSGPIGTTAAPTTEMQPCRATPPWNDPRNSCSGFGVRLTPKSYVRRQVIAAPGEARPARRSSGVPPPARYLMTSGGSRKASEACRGTVRPDRGPGPRPLRGGSVTLGGCSLAGGEWGMLWRTAGRGVGPCSVTFTTLQF
jgi:hypothetical protein